MRDSKLRRQNYRYNPEILQVCSRRRRKANITVKRVKRVFGFLVVIKVKFTLYSSRLSLQQPYV